MVLDEANTERKSNRLDNAVAKKLFCEYLKITGRKVCVSPLTGNYINDLFLNYIQVIGTKDEIIFNELLKKYNYNFSFSVVNSLCYLFGKGQNIDMVNPSDWPGIYSIDGDGVKYILHTEIGDIEVYKASEVFKGTNTSFVFKRKRIHQCFYRTLDFVKKNQEFDAVVTLMPNSFKGGYFHAYAIMGDTLVDPALNSIFINRGIIDKLYSGEVIERLSYKEICDRFNKIKEVNPSIDNGSILYDVTLSSYVKSIK